MLCDCGAEFTISAEEVVPHNAIGFQLLAGAEVTLVVSNTSERYRLQSDCFEALALFRQSYTPSSLQHLDTLLDGTFLQVSSHCVCLYVGLFVIGRGWGVFVTVRCLLYRN